MKTYLVVALMVGLVVGHEFYANNNVPLGTSVFLAAVIGAAWPLALGKVLVTTR